MEQVYWAIIMPGACAANHLAQLVGVADNREKAARALASQLGCEAYGSAQALYQAQKPDTVIIATPDAFHREPFLAALDAGVKSIICEKPLATTVAESEEMAQAARQAGARIFINFANRFAHLFMATYRVVRGGLIGRPVYGDTYLDDNISVPLRLWGDRSREWASTSSTAFFLFPHMLDLLHWIYAPARIEAVQAMKQNVVLGFTPDLYEAFFHWDNGLKTHVKAEWVKHIEGLVEFSLSLGGAEGSVIARRVAGYHSTEAWRAMLDAGIPAERVDDIVRELIASGGPCARAHDSRSDVQRRKRARLSRT